MTGRMLRPLSEEDRVLWSKVARSATPLKGKAMADLVEAEPEPTREAFAATIDAPPRPAPAQPRRHAAVQTTLDRPVHDKLAKGRLPIEGRVDLHGMTQEQAYGLLLSFLSRAHANDIRFVLVITGKGSQSGGDGVLRRAVPGWLSTAPFRALVGSHDHAARNHGGAGALYVRLRRRAPR